MLQSNNGLTWIVCSGELKSPGAYLHDNHRCEKKLLKVERLEGFIYLQIKCNKCKAINDVYLSGYEGI